MFTLSLHWSFVICHDTGFCWFQLKFTAKADEFAALRLVLLTFPYRKQPCTKHWCKHPLACRKFKRQKQFLSQFLTQNYDCLHFTYQIVPNAARFLVWSRVGAGLCLSVLSNQRTALRCLGGHGRAFQNGRLGFSALVFSAWRCQKLPGIKSRFVREKARRWDVWEGATRPEKSWAGLLAVLAGAALAAPPPPQRSTTWANNSRHQKEPGRRGGGGCNFKASGSPVLPAEALC